jgi:hypothetical protein
MSTECTLHCYDRVTLRNVGFDGKCALLVGPRHLYDWRVVTGTSRLPAPFEPNPTIPRPSLPSQCPTESRDDILPHSVVRKLTLFSMLNY